MPRAASPFASLLLFALGAEAAGTRRAGQVMDALRNCWDQCSSAAGGGDCMWFQPSCICTLANNTPYLASTVTCAKQTCSDFSAIDVNRFISPIQFTCSLAGGIDQSRVDAAQAAASAPLSTASSAAPKPSSAPAPAPAPAPSPSPAPSPKSSAKPTPVPSSEPSPSPTHAATTVETTLSVTTTDSEGSSAVIGQPLSIGPSGVSSGKRTTSVIKSTSNNGDSSSFSEQTTTSDGIVMATGMPLPVGTSTSASTTSHSTSAPGGGGTLFDSQGDAAGLAAGRSVVLLCLAGVATFALAVAL